MGSLAYFQDVLSRRSFQAFLSGFLVHNCQWRPCGFIQVFLIQSGGPDVWKTWGLAFWLSLLSGCPDFSGLLGCAGAVMDGSVWLVILAVLCQVFLIRPRGLEGRKTGVMIG